MRHTGKVAALGLALIAVLALVVAACSSSDVEKSDLDAANTRIDALEEQTTKAQMLAASNAIRDAGLHDLDESINAADAIDTSWVGRATMARRAVASVTWPAEMKGAADTVLANLTELEAALNAEDLDAAKTASHDAHENYHELDHMASPYYAGETPAPEDEHDEASESASATAAAH